MKDIRNYLDKKGYLYQKSNIRENYIDSNFLTTNMVYQKSAIGGSIWFNKNGLSYMAKNAGIDYTASKGVIRRYPENFGKLIGANPEETTRYTNPNHVSRDNSMGMMIMQGHFGAKAAVRAFMLNTIKRGSFFQNTHTVKGEKKILPDFCGPEQWALLLRCGLPKIALILLYPVLLVLDIFLLLNYSWHVIQSRFIDASHTSTVLHMLSGVLLCRSMQTPFSYLSEKIFLNYRAQVPGFEDKEPIVSALKYYSRQTYDPPIYELGAEVVGFLRRK